tara:strand:- start:71 stop:532 length:462 start_codon:yes stop_codon:yes gene_type:complete
MKKPFIVNIVLLLSVLATAQAFFKLIDFSRREIMMQYLGPSLGQFDYFMDILMFIFSIALIVGYSSRQKWAWKGTFYYYGFYLFGSLGGLVIGLFYPEKVMEAASLIKYGEIQAAPYGNEMLIYLGIGALVVQLIIVYFICKRVYVNKDYFKY